MMLVMVRAMVFVLLCFPLSLHKVTFVHNIDLLRVVINERMKKIIIECRYSEVIFFVIERPPVSMKRPDLLKCDH